MSMQGLVSANKFHGRVTVLYRQAVKKIKLCNALSVMSVTSTQSLAKDTVRMVLHLLFTDLNLHSFSLMSGSRRCLDYINVKWVSR